MSIKLTVAAVLLLIVGIWGVLEGAMALSSPEWYLDAWIAMTNEGLRPQTVSDFMMFTTQFLGLVALGGSLLFCVVSLIPYRKGEKWAWYAMLVIGGIHVFGALTFTYTSMTSHLPVIVIMVILWIVGIALPVKEVFHKPS